MATIDLHIDAYVEVNRDWTEIGTEPWLDTCNESNPEIDWLKSTTARDMHEYFTFDNLPAASSVSEVLLKTYSRSIYLNLLGWLYDGSAWGSAYSLGNGNWVWAEHDVTSFLGTVAKVNAARFKVQSSVYAPYAFEGINCAFLRVTYTPSAPTGQPYASRVQYIMGMRTFGGTKS